MTLAEFVSARDLAADVPAPSRSGAASGGHLRHDSLHVGLSHAAAALAAVVFAYVSAPLAGPLAWLMAAFVVAVLIAELVTLQGYERTRSLRPARHLLEFTGVVLLAGTGLGRLGPGQVRGAVLVVVPAAAVLAAAVKLSGCRRAPRAVLVIGCLAGAGQLLGDWGNRADLDVRGLCLADDSADVPREFMGVRVLGAVADAADVAVGLGVAEVVIAPGPQLAGAEVRQLSWALERSGIELCVLADVHGVRPHRVESRVLGDRLLLSVRPGRRSSPARYLKGVIDRAGAAVLICFCAPLLVLLVLAVRRDSPGPAVFRQTRIGLEGKPFVMYKFRTMVVDAEALLDDLRGANEGAGPMFKLADDPRTTRVGRMLRRASLDELPQLVNVLKGDMSLIGPRPCLPAEASQYDGWVGRRLSSKPGMTGAWQVSGRSGLSWQDSVRLDLDYVDNWTMRGDLAIAARTVGAVIRREGAL